MPLKKNDAKASAPVKQEAAKAQAAVAAEQVVQEAGEAALLGSKSNTLVFVASLGDPSNPDITTLDNGQKRTLPTVVGFRFKATEDIEVPDVAVGDDFKNNLMSFKGDTMATRHVAAGTEFDLTKFELGMLISREEYNGVATGGDKPVVCSYNTTVKKGSTGAVMTTEGVSTIPSVSLRAKTPGVSIKDYPIINVLTCTTEKGADGKTTSKTRTIVPGFEKFAPLCAKAQRASSGSGSSANTAVRNKGAQAFLAIASKHAGK